MEREGVNQELHSGRHQIDSSLVPPGGLRKKKLLDLLSPRVALVGATGDKGKRLELYLKLHLGLRVHFLPGVMLTPGYRKHWVFASRGS